MAKYISGDYEATCEIHKNCKIAVTYHQNPVTGAVGKHYACYNDFCSECMCAANEEYNGNDETYFKLGKLIAPSNV